MLIKQNCPLCLPKVEPYWNFVCRLLSCKRFHPMCQYFVISSTSMGVEVILMEEPVWELFFLHALYIFFMLSEAHRQVALCCVHHKALLVYAAPMEGHGKHVVDGHWWCKSLIWLFLSEVWPPLHDFSRLLIVLLSLLITSNDPSRTLSELCNIFCNVMFSLSYKQWRSFNEKPGI